MLKGNSFVVFLHAVIYLYWPALKYLGYGAVHSQLEHILQCSSLIYQSVNKLGLDGYCLLPCPSFRVKQFGTEVFGIFPGFQNQLSMHTKGTTIFDKLYW